MIINKPYLATID